MALFLILKDVGTHYEPVHTRQTGLSDVSCADTLDNSEIFYTPPLCCQQSWKPFSCPVSRTLFELDTLPCFQLLELTLL